MIVKETPWEKRNLGVNSSVEFYVEALDTWITVAQQVLNRNEEYQVMHIPSGNTDVLMKASQNGFISVELNFQLENKLDNIELPSLYRRFEKSISFVESTPDEKRGIIDAIRFGNLFTTDKVARDPCFGVEKAGNRYAYWTEDVLAEGAIMLSLKYKSKMVAFDIIKDKGNGIAEAFLGGILPPYKESGLGFIGTYFAPVFAKTHGFCKLVTGVSSNNMPILKLHELFGYRIESASYCLIKHK